jgi:hypothetical protein
MEARLMDIVTHGITYRGTNYVTSSAGQLRYCFRVVRGYYSGVEVRGTDSIIPGTAGRTARNRKRDRRLIEIEGFVQGVGTTLSAAASDFETAMAQVKTDFDPTAAAGTLVMTLQDGSTKSISARVLPETLEGDDVIPTRRRLVQDQPPLVGDRPRGP